ncbi:hypothetical protein HanRHA438_Chr07g0295641 [Helianthus annuus]|uniref:Uncharacterized protein n=1 Tax=Helianthus annuus TaxID=4232 RepID=A0A9K3IJD0_HELAN|nr:hypothetical protein HanXRQr2_Chr07g0285081 [Helianthus annuus]KAJ0555882.1 hypothetical protein HanIR_Chr07g0307241 [Helianthus annuus]KAJ0903952.1 hypothetical protein HanPSC8_Chr07g0276031 [Helianthus annuus]KAJ0907165.1 hypothetical protein HanRHA438_Chr07g0295641 [Helianthus annuus]
MWFLLKQCIVILIFSHEDFRLWFLSIINNMLLGRIRLQTPFFLQSVQSHITP